MIELEHAQRAQRAVRRFSDRPVPRELVEHCVRAAVQAPSGSNAQRWEWILVCDAEVRARLAALHRVHAERYLSRPGPRAPGIADGLRWMADHLGQVPWLVVPCYWRADGGGTDAGLYASIYPAVQNFLLAATALGLGTTLTTMILRDEDALRAVLRLPEGLVPCALIPVGHPLDGPVRKRRRPVEEVVHLDAYRETSVSLRPGVTSGAPPGPRA